MPSPFAMNSKAHREFRHRNAGKNFCQACKRNLADPIPESRNSSPTSVTRLHVNAKPIAAAIALHHECMTPSH
jgi:hypothetical protein